MKSTDEVNAWHPTEEDLDGFLSLGGWIRACVSCASPKQMTTRLIMVENKIRQKRHAADLWNTLLSKLALEKAIPLPKEAGDILGKIMIGRIPYDTAMSFLIGALYVKSGRSTRRRRNTAAL